MERTPENNYNCMHEEPETGDYKTGKMYQHKNGMYIGEIYGSAGDIEQAITDYTASDIHRWFCHNDVDSIELLNWGS